MQTLYIVLKPHNQLYWNCPSQITVWHKNIAPNFESFNPDLGLWVVVLAESKASSAADGVIKLLLRPGVPPGVEWEWEWAFVAYDWLKKEEPYFFVQTCQWAHQILQLKNEIHIPCHHETTLCIGVRVCISVWGIRLSLTPKATSAAWIGAGALTKHCVANLNIFSKRKYNHVKKMASKIFILTDYNMLIYIIIGESTRSL